MLKIEHLTKTYGDKVAVNDLSLEIKAGEIYGFIGHNGAGKTTTIKSVVGIHSFDSGEIYIDGISIKEDPIKAKSLIAYIPDNPDLYNYMKGVEYLEFISDIFKIDANTRKTKILEYSKLLGIDKDLGELISNYSHGMRQKLAIVGALIHSPKLIIMDEPFVGLDPVASHELKQIMKKVCEEGGAFFFSTHVLEVAEKLCNKVAIIKEGKIIKSGEIEEVIGDTTLENVFLELEDKHA